MNVQLFSLNINYSTVWTIGIQCELTFKHIALTAINIVCFCQARNLVKKKKSMENWLQTNKRRMWCIFSTYKNIDTNCFNMKLFGMIETMQLNSSKSANCLHSNCNATDKWYLFIKILKCVFEIKIFSAKIIKPSHFSISFWHGIKFDSNKLKEQQKSPKKIQIIMRANDGFFFTCFGL